MVSRIFGALFFATGPRMRLLVFFLSPIACPLFPVLAQSTNATLTGFITDQSKAAMVGVKVDVINLDTNAHYSSTTNGEGSYSVPNLPPGNYKIEVEHPGFKSIVKPDVVLHVQDVVAINFTMAVGSASESVTVEGGTPLVNTESAAVSTVVDRQFVANIPLNGRSLQALIQLVPGVVLNPPSFAGGSISGFSINGQRTTSNYFMVDGLSANTGITLGTPGSAGSGQAPGTTALGGTNSLVSLDALQEFRIETSTFAPEFGRMPGGQISLVTRGGTNSFHGSASYYFRNEALDANDWFANSRRQPKPRERQSLFSGVLGGPIKRNRLFFFGSYEGLWLQQPQAKLISVPTTELRARAVPFLRPYLNALPLPNGRDLGDGTAELAASYSDPSTFDAFGLRVDGNITDKVTTFLRFSHAPSGSSARDSGLSTVTSSHFNNDSVTGALTWGLRPHLTADLRLNWVRNEGRSVSDLDSFRGAVVPTVSDAFAPGFDPSQAQFIFSGLRAGWSWGLSDDSTQRQVNAMSNVDWLLGQHHLRFGIDYRRIFPLISGAGAFESLQVSTIEQIVGGTAASYLIRNVDRTPREPIFASLSLYAQDTWRASKRLTFTYGARLERVPPPSEETGRLARTLLGIDTEPFQNLRLAPEGTPLWDSARGLAPRAGVSYQLYTRPGWATTVRGGAGLFYDLSFGDIANSLRATNYPFSADRSTPNASLPLSPAIRTPPVLGVSPPGTMTVMDPNVRLPYTVQWNATLEQALGTPQVLRVSYVGATGNRLLVDSFYLNQMLADFPTSRTRVDIQRSKARSRYDSLQVQYQRLLQHGLQVLASYTLGTSEDNASQASQVTPATQSLLAHEWGPSDFDIRHVFSAALTYEVPGFSAHGLLRAVTRHWAFDLLIRSQSAYPANPVAGSVLLSDGTFYSPRPDLVPGQPLYISDPLVPFGRRYNRQAFTPPAVVGQQGSFPRNGLRGFPASQVDFSSGREFVLAEKVRLQLRGELFNLFNHPNFGGPITDISNALFGQPTQMLNRSLGGLNQLYQIGGPRSIQLALKLQF